MLEHTMPSPVLELRPTTIEDAALVADLDSVIAPDDPRDREMQRFWWTHQWAAERTQRLINVRDGEARMFVYAGHEEFVDDAPRFGRMRIRLHPDDWTEERYRAGVTACDEWLRAEGADTTVTNVREDFERDLGLLRAMGFVEVRSARVWSLDLGVNRQRLLEAAARTRAGMERAGVELTTLDRIDSPAVRRRLHQLDLETTNDIPTTVPEPMPDFEEWERFWFENPAHRPEREWMALEDGVVVGLSLIGYPPERGIPWTSFTCTARSVRGRGIARALKYATVEQAIGLGAREVHTANDSENAPILHLNEEMGYRLFHRVIELHRAL
jgi:RimJ/RimL family protein N-acetyltransferase